MLVQEELHDEANGDVQRGHCRKRLLLQILQWHVLQLDFLKYD